MNITSLPKTFGIFESSAHRKLIEELENNGSKVLRFAPVKARKIKTDLTGEQISDLLNDVDWMIFPDVYAVEYFLELLSERNIDLFELDAVRVLAYGEAVADKLRFVQLHADIITASDDTNTVFSTLLNYVGEDEISNLKYFILYEAGNYSQLKDSLIESKAKVSSLPVYEIEEIDKSEASKIKTFLKGGTIDEFIFTSPEDVFSLKKYFMSENLKAILTDTQVSGTNEVSLRSLIENNLLPSKFAAKNAKKG